MDKTLNVIKLEMNGPDKVRIWGTYLNTYGSREGDTDLFFVDIPLEKLQELLIHGKTVRC